MKLRVNKNRDYTILSNYHLRDKKLSLKGKGLLSVMLSLPDNWNYSIDGLVAILKEKETSVISTLNELKELGYITIIKLLPDKTDSGRIEYLYDIYETPQKQEVEKQALEKQGVEIQDLENMGLVLDNNIYNINNNIENNKLNTNNKILNNKKIYKKYGEYKRIELTDNEYNNLIKEFGEDYIKDIITKLDEYVECNNNKNSYKNYNLVIRRAIREKWFISCKKDNNTKGITKKNDYSSEFLRDGIKMEEL